MKYYIIAGEASGDLHGSNLIKEIRKKDPGAEIRFWGGDLMADAAGSAPVKHYKQLAFMGFWEVITHLRTILGNLKFCKSDIARFKPDVLVFIDYPGFNMRIAQWAKAEGFKTAYYISPQVWAWKPHRAKALKRDVDCMLTILPFEAEFYKKYQFDVDFVGHPLLDALFQYEQLNDEEIRKELGLGQKKIIALLPGSRSQEIKTKFPIMMEAVRGLEGYEIVVAGAPGQDETAYSPYIHESVKITHGKTYKLLSIAHAALVTSGTATLETALFNVPQVVMYRGSELSYQIAKRLVKVEYISLVNLVMQREVVTELIQNECTPKRARQELEKILDDNMRQKVFYAYAELREKLGGAGASARAAEKIIALAKR